MSTNDGEAIVTRLLLGGNDFELAETPKGLLIPRINGMDLSASEVKDLKEALNVLPD
ncbi:hypothetical protein HWB90_gp098 [Mycobacterium phage Fowlmouth]|uniref:Uncharacterized protein n=2 Tax=Fowlmouthvirus fowlmouth TaxID=2845652 RepID=A0A7G8LPY2_9CAUD|nr:hypothetical protein HWB90_gp098 [Mycobacterium phage Fowlmouth]AYN58041.1 hypothetical protein SEA_FOWLMOUTH_92 [Mycobacterium phage Fowlmouth]QNJ59304.1 hypothetical protein SEA_MRMIYAGI_91 [Mycobacterium phage MrMiyagi]